MLNFFKTKREQELDQDIEVFEDYFHLLQNLEAKEAVLKKQIEINRALKARIRLMEDPMNRSRN